MESPSNPKTPKSARVTSPKSPKMKVSIGKFTFLNGDNYEGGYQIDIDKRNLIKQDYGVYRTNDFNVYEGKWHKDEFGNDEFHIRYNNDAQYIGKIDVNGAMNGVGTYIFPDGSSLTATWSQNKPVSDVVYRQSIGPAWIITSLNDNHCYYMHAVCYIRNWESFLDREVFGRKLLAKLSRIIVNQLDYELTVGFY